MKIFKCTFCRLEHGFTLLQLFFKSLAFQKFLRFSYVSYIKKYCHAVFCNIQRRSGSFVWYIIYVATLKLRNTKTSTQYAPLQQCYNTELVFMLSYTLQKDSVPNCGYVLESQLKTVNQKNHPVCMLSQPFDVQCHLLQQCLLSTYFGSTLHFYLYPTFQ